MIIARKLRDDLLARYTEMRRKPNEIKAFQTMSVTETGVFQDRLVMTASISLRAVTIARIRKNSFQLFQAESVNLPDIALYSGL